MHIRQHRGVISIIGITLVMLIVLSQQISQQNPIVQEFATTDTLPARIMVEDFKFALERLEKVHPMTLNGFSEEQRAMIGHIRQKISVPMKKSEFFFLVNHLFYTFHDAHTNMWPSWQKGIPVALLWLQDGLFIEYDSEYLRRGDKIVTIGEKSERELFEEMKNIVCGENEHYVKLTGQGFIISISYLDYANLIEEDSVRIVVERDRQVIETKLPVINLGPRPKAKDYTWISYKIDEDNDLAILELNECRFDEIYKSTIKKFFENVSRSNVNTVVVDLRRNVGGNSNVINEFFRYLDVDNYKWYGGDIRYSEYARAQKNERGYGYKQNPPSIMRNRRVAYANLLFHGKLFVLTSKNTFSSANMFAVTIKDNRLGTIIGEPTGNSPTCYGNPLEFKMPNTQIDFRISYKYFPRPDPRSDPENTLFPDIEVYTNQTDLINNTDPQFAKVVELVR